MRIKFRHSDAALPIFSAYVRSDAMPMRYCRRSVVLCGARLRRADLILSLVVAAARLSFPMALRHRLKSYRPYLHIRHKVWSDRAFFCCIPDEGCNNFRPFLIASPTEDAYFSPVLLHPRRGMHIFCPFYCIPDGRCAFFVRFFASPTGDALFLPILLHPRREMHVFRPFRCIPDWGCTFSVVFNTPYTYGAMHSP